jgi:uncharacterized glyoxalase superfamily protein PhnB
MQLQGLVPLIQVFDMPESVAFYRDVLGFELVDHSPEIEAAEGRYFHWCWLRHGSAELMLNTLHDANERPPARDEERSARLAREVCLFIGCADLDAAWAELQAKGVASARAPVKTPYGMRQLKLTDPDGYALCLQWRA